MSRILLVRHGQASFGAADYDQLSELGADQARALGRSLARRGLQSPVLVAGEMKRHVQTARAMQEGAGWELPVDPDAGWNEFDHLQVLSVHTPPEEPTTERAAFQEWFEAATARWTSGHHDEQYDESFATFSRRVEAALHRLTSALPSGGTAIVVTSGGPIAWVAATLLGGGADVWMRLNAVTVNSGVSTVTVGRRGTTLVSFNEHSHVLGQSPDLLTYR